MRRYLPNTVITAIVPCLTDTNEDNKITRIIKTNIKNGIDAPMAYIFK
jgi:hypothetical protein